MRFVSRDSTKAGEAAVYRLILCLLLVEEELPEDPHCVFWAVDGVADSPRVGVNLIIVSTLVRLQNVQL